MFYIFPILTHQPLCKLPLGPRKQKWTGIFTGSYLLHDILLMTKIKRAMFKRVLTE